MISTSPGMQVESIALQEVKVHPSMGSSEEATIQIVYYMDINGTICGPCSMQIDTARLPDEERAIAIFLEYVESKILTMLGGQREEITDDKVPEGIIKKGF